MKKRSLYGQISAKREKQMFRNINKRGSTHFGKFNLISSPINFYDKVC